MSKAILEMKILFLDERIEKLRGKIARLVEWCETLEDWRHELWQEFAEHYSAPMSQSEMTDYVMFTPDE